MKTFHILFLGLLVCVLAACENQALLSDTEGEPDNNGLPGFFLDSTPLNVPDVDGEEDKNASEDSGGTGTEGQKQEAIDNIVILIFRPDASGTNIFVGREAVMADKFEVVGGRRKVYVKNFLLRRNDIIYVLANLPEDLYGKEINSLSESDIDDTYKLTSPSVVKEDGSELLPMGGKVVWMERNITCTLKHAVARFRLELGKGVFEGKEVSYQFKNYVKSGNFGTQPLYVPGRQYGNVTGKDGKDRFTVDEHVYIFAYPHSTYGQGSACDNQRFNARRAHLLITVSDPGQSGKKEYYRLDLHDGKTYMDVVPNGDYVFRITYAGSNGYGTEQDAQNNPGSNLKTEFCPNTQESTSWDWVCQIYNNGPTALYTSLTSEYVMLEPRTYDSYTALYFAMASPLASLTNNVKVSVSGRGLNLQYPTDAGRYTYKTGINITTDSNFRGGNIHIAAGNIQYDIPVYQKQVVEVDCHYVTLPYANVHKARVLDSSLVPWVELSKECASNLDYDKEKMFTETISEVSRGENVYVHFDENLDMGNKGNPLPRKAIVLMEHYDKDGLVTTLYEFSQVSVKYIGTYGGMQDRYPNSRGLAMERMEEKYGIQSSFQWGFYNQDMGTGVANDDEGKSSPYWLNGWYNTKMSGEQSGTMTAARVCYEKNRGKGGTLSDSDIKWYLPSAGQLEKMVEKISNSNYYWSATESTDTQKAYIVCTGPYITPTSRNNSYRVRCVRDI